MIFSRLAMPPETNRLAQNTGDLATLYPPLAPFDAGRLKVDDLHTLYYEQSGNPEGVPVIVLHGGPGAGSSPKQRQFFDPKHYRIILFDQRGSGQSTPMGELRQNTTALLVSDLEQLRAHLGIDRWHVFGGSWGSTLGLCYGIAHPDRALSLTLRGIFMMRQSEMDHFITGMGATFPEAREEFIAPLSADERKDIVGSYYKLLTHPDPQVHMPAARRWSAYEFACFKLIPETADLPQEPSAQADAHALAVSRLECHYFIYNRFDPDDYILKNMGRIRQIPGVIVQGRYDMVCPPITAYDLHKSWPEAEFIIVPDAGHSSSEPGVTSALVTAMDAFRRITA